MEKLLLVTNFGSKLLTIFVKEEQDEVADRKGSQAREHSVADPKTQWGTSEDHSLVGT